MPQVDLETLVSVCAGGSCDRKIACETTFADDGDIPIPPKEPDLQEIPPDFPPDSFWLSKDAEFDWFDRNVFYERKESHKGNSNSNSNSTTNSNPNLNPNSNSTSQRFSLNLKSKASIIGLPKPQKSCFADAKLRRNIRPANPRFFPKRPEPTGKSAVPANEPSSPKVSCMGRVRSKRDRSRRLQNRQRSLKEKPKPEPEPERRRKMGLWTNFRAIFRTGCRHKPAVETDERMSPIKLKSVGIKKESPPRKSVTAKGRDLTSTSTSTSIEEAEAPGLGGMKHFASGRRSGAWSVDDMDVTKSEP